MKAAILFAILSIIICSTTVLAYSNHSSSRVTVRTTKNGNTYTRSVETTKNSNGFTRSTAVANDTTGKSKDSTTTVTSINGHPSVTHSKTVN